MYVHWLHKTRGVSEAELGSKGATLAKLIRLNVPVPPGFCVAASAYSRIVHRVVGEATTGVRANCVGVTTETSPPRPSADSWQRVRSAVSSAVVPSDLRDEIVAAYRMLRLEYDPSEQGVVVRSSAQGEDSSVASFAGQFDSYQNVSGETAVLEHVLRCWASAWSHRALQYRADMGRQSNSDAMAVVVQRLIRATSAGVMFTADPISGDTSEVLINSSWGLGSSVASGLVNPDSFAYSKDHKSIISRTVNSKHLMIEADCQLGTRRRPVPGHMAHQPSLTDGQIRHLCEIALTIEHSMGRPQDIEWCLQDGLPYIVQSRPITTLS